ncbi:MAG: dTDP-4-dehydrorhamnose reductase [Candidatus Omnitrophota bacterium]|jgi:dTDP-4-dehydrorhamnose reductase
MKILLTGSAGMLSADVIPELIRQGHDLIQTDINQRLPVIRKLDITDPDEVSRQVGLYKPDYVFHLGAETDVDLCEKEPDRAYYANTFGTENVVLACRRYDVKMLYISTAGVFYGDKQDPYTEFDEPNPANVYGKSKLEGERIVKDLLDEYFIIRAGWMVGGWEIDKKFVYKIVRQLKEGKTQLTAVNDKFGSPTFTKYFALNFMNIINTRRYGTYHLACKGECSRYDMAVKIVEYMGLEGKAKVDAVSSDRYPLPAPRARSEIMRNYKLDILGLNNMPKWQDCLKEYIQTNMGK